MFQSGSGALPVQFHCYRHLADSFAYFNCIHLCILIGFFFTQQSGRDSHQLGAVPVQYLLESIGDVGSWSAVLVRFWCGCGAVSGGSPCYSRGHYPAATTTTAAITNNSNTSSKRNPSDLYLFIFFFLASSRWFIIGMITSISFINPAITGNKSGN